MIGSSRGGTSCSGWEALCLAAVEDNVRIQGIRNLMDRRAAWALARWCSHCRLCSVGTLSSLAWRLRATGAALRLWTSYVANLMPDCTATIRAFRNQRRRVELLRTLARMASALAHADGQANAREMAEGYHERKMLREGMTLWRRDVQRRTELLFLDQSAAAASTPHHDPRVHRARGTLLRSSDRRASLLALLHLHQSPILHV